MRPDGTGARAVTRASTATCNSRKARRGDAPVRSKCATENPAGKRFCVGCGSLLPTVCPQCGAENTPSFKFGGDCGASLSAASSPPSNEASTTGSPSRSSGHERVARGRAQDSERAVRGHQVFGVNYSCRRIDSRFLLPSGRSLPQVNCYRAAKALRGGGGDGEATEHGDTARA
jgi:hypothetical protein